MRDIKDAFGPNGRAQKPGSDQKRSHKSHRHNDNAAVSGVPVPWTAHEKALFSYTETGYPSMIIGGYKCVTPEQKESLDALLKTSIPVQEVPGFARSKFISEDVEKKKSQTLKGDKDTSSQPQPTAESTQPPAISGDGMG